MDYLLLLLGLSFVLACIHFLYKTLRAPQFGPVNLPPGPRPFPVIGNIFELGNKPHQALADLSKIYGPIMSLKLGSITSVVISSPQLAKEALQKHDQALSSRAVPDGARGLDHHKDSIAWLPASAPWRNLRKVCATQMFNAQRLDATQALRGKKVQELLDYVHESCRSGTSAVDVRQAVFTTVLNSISNTFFSIDLAHYQSDVSQSFNDLVHGVMEELGRPNIADYFPILRAVDPQGIRKCVKTSMEKLFTIFDGIIHERIQARETMASKESKDLLDSLLNLVEENSSLLSLSGIKHLLLDLFFGGVDTTSITVEWAMAELLHNPEKLRKAQTELREVLGKDGRLVQEFDITKFPYLQAIMKETLRLHPPGPFLVPHKAETEVEICGYVVPKTARVLVNVWAMGRDSSVWRNPTSFMPERFLLGSEIDVKGRDFELIPFGAGRRICPGLALAQRMVHLILASLLYTFDWKLAHNLSPENMDMTERFGLTLNKSEPLIAVPIKV